MNLICRVCNTTQSKTNFYKSSNRLYYDRICKSCKHERMTQKRQDFKKWAIEYKGGKCNICSYNKCEAALDFHHINPHEKEFDFGGDGGNLMSKDKARKELDKFVLLCCRCHREVHVGYSIVI